MKKYLLGFVFLFSTNLLFAQMVDNPVTWKTSVKKVDAKTYEITLIANLEGGWHTYSQNTPDGGPIPTSVTFTKNPLVIPQGKTKEIGKLESHVEPLFGGVKVLQYSNQVKYLQVVKLKAPVKTSVEVAVNYMVCDDHQCLPPKTQKFTVALK